MSKIPNFEFIRGVEKINNEYFVVPDCRYIINPLDNTFSSGLGATSYVWFGFDTTKHDEIAVKIMKPSFEIPVDPLLPGDRQVDAAEATFYREANLLMDLNHRNILPLRDYCLINEHRRLLPVIVTPRIKGEKLAKTNLFEIETLSDVWKELANGLDYCHSNGVLHRDFCPDNVMIEKGSNRPLIIDFGFANRVFPKNNLLIFGHIGYMSLDTVLGNSFKESDDRYSFFSTIYSTLTGHSPLIRDGEELKNEDFDENKIRLMMPSLYYQSLKKSEKAIKVLGEKVHKFDQIFFDYFVNKKYKWKKCTELVRLLLDD